MEQLILVIKRDKDFSPLCDKYLAKAEPDQVNQFFIQCLEENNLPLAQICLKYLTNINFGNASLFDPCLGKKINPLIEMCTRGKLDAVKFLVENGADIEHLSYCGTTAIMFAFQESHMNIVVYLLERGAQIEVGSKKMTEYAKDADVLKEMINLYDRSIRHLRKQLEIATTVTDLKVIGLNEIDD